MQAKLQIPDMLPLIHELARHMARMLRRQAEGEPAIVRDFAERVAADFEAGVSEEPE